MTGPAHLWPGRVRAAYGDVLGEAAAVEEGFGPVTVVVPADRWVEAVTVACDGLGCTFFDFLTAVDEGEAGFAVVCHLVAHTPRRRGRGGAQHLLVRTVVTDAVASLVGVYAGAAWHERETAEMFGLAFLDPDGNAVELEGLLLPEGFEGYPLRKDFILASRVAKPWPGAKEPGESAAPGHDAPARRRTRPPGVPEPGDWGPRRE